MYASYHRCTAEGSMGGKEDAILLCRFSLSKARQTRALAFVLAILFVHRPPFCHAGKR